MLEENTGEVEIDLDAEQASWEPEHAADVQASFERSLEADRRYATKEGIA